MLNIKVLNFNAEMVKASRSANRGRGGNGDYSFAAAMREAEHAPPEQSEQPAIVRDKSAQAPEEPAIPVKNEELDIDEGADQNTAAAELFTAAPLILQQQAEPDDVPERQQDIVSILEGTSPDTDMTPTSAEAALPETAVNPEREGETARMPQQQEAFTVPAAESGAQAEQTAVTGAAERPVVIENDGTCPLENENDTQTVQAAPAQVSPEKTGQESKGDSDEPLGEQPAGTPKTAATSPEKPQERTGAKTETSETQEMPGDRQLNVPAQRLDSAERFDAEVLGAEKAEKPVRPSELFDTMVERMDMASNADGKVMTIQLRPDFLGKVQIQLSMTENGLSAKILTEDASVRGLINSQLSQLVESLSDKGVKVNEVEVLYTGISDHEFDGSHSKRDAREDASAAGSPKGRIVRVESALEMVTAPYAGWEVTDDGYYAGDSSVEYTA